MIKDYWKGGDTMEDERKPTTLRLSTETYKRFTDFAQRNNMHYYQAFELMVKQFLKTFKRTYE